MRVLLLLLLVVTLSVKASGQVYAIKSGTVRFYSEAPKELISASSDKLRGMIDLGKKTFAFKIVMSSFMGFNSSLQQEHFNENYMESAVYPEASFNGKIIEDVDLSKDGEYYIRAKGKLRIHGVEQERIIKSFVTVKNGKVSVRSDFVVALADHNIKIPRIVIEKLAPDIDVSVNAVMAQRN